MNYRFIIEVRTNSPDEVQNALVNALELHKPMQHLQWNVSEHELSSHIKPDLVGTSLDGDPWRFYVEVETNSPDWTRREIERAIRNHTTAAQLRLTVESGHILMGEESTSDDVDDWLKEQDQGKE